MTQPEAVELFFSYSHNDRDLREELERHLAVLRRQGVISVWHDRQITAGTPWAGQIDAHIDRAQVILLLISADFVSSDYCYDREMTRALARHAAGEARVIPVLLRDVDWSGAPFSHLQAVPTDGVPVTSWENRDEAFADVARAIRRAVTELAAQPSIDVAAPTSRAATTAGYFPTQQQLIEEQARGVIGRAYVEEALDRFISNQRCGYFIIQGAPGSGKSAIAARLVVKRSPIHHVIGRTGRRSDVRLILLSLIEQLGFGSAAEDLTTTPVDELLARFERALQARARASAPLLLLFDALNELTPDDVEPLFLPTDTLPPGVFVVVTSQPGERLTRLSGQLATLPTQVYQLGPLTPEEVREMVVSHQPEATAPLIDRVERASLGNPLYIRATMDALALGLHGDADGLPHAVEGYFRHATRALPDNRLLRDVLGFLAVSRKNLSLPELSQLTNATQRSVATTAIASIRPFLLDISGSYAFYHERFYDFVVRDLLYEDELRDYHERVAKWLESPDAKGRDYYWTSLTYHMFKAGDLRALERIDDRFLAEKLRRFGYAVLEDLELLAAAVLSTGHPSSVEQCVARFDALRDVVGSSVVDEMARTVQPNLRGPHSRSLAPRLSLVPGIDAHAILMPKREVTADFIEVVPRDGHLVVAIGDAPLSGLKSAFVARFIATLFRSLVLAPGPLGLERVVDQVTALISRHSYFEHVSMQCVDIALDEGVMTMVNAGHPYPVLYSTRYSRCDRLAVRGPLLHARPVDVREASAFRARHAEIGAGSVIVLVSDGITEGGPIKDPYGYRFTSVIERHASASAKSLCDAIVSDWRNHRGEDPATDDATILVLVLERGA
jgi:serine phosphatase RsbU (regulator of sigma subunit)